MKILKWITFGWLIMGLFAAVPIIGTTSATRSGDALARPIVFLGLALLFAMIWGAAAGIRKLVRVYSTSAE